MVWQNVVNALIGIWFIIAPFSLAFTSNAAEMWTSIIGGVILLVLAGAAALNEKARRQVWIQYVDGLVGVWFIIAPWVLSFTARAGELWTSLIGGVIVLVLSAWLAFGVLPKAAATH
jgi:uncharacterized integral membrane protein